jgi:hypothetical protein
MVSEHGRAGIQKRLAEIESALARLSSQLGMKSSEILDNPKGIPLEILEPMFELLEEKLSLQKKLYGIQGGSLSNVVLLSERLIG